MFSIKVGTEDRGPFFSEAELAAALDAYEADNPDDPEFHRVTVQEMPEHGTVGHERSVWDFVDSE
jgi:hypothetical protein